MIRHTRIVGWAEAGLDFVAWLSSVKKGGFRVLGGAGEEDFRENLLH